MNNVISTANLPAGALAQQRQAGTQRHKVFSLLRTVHLLLISLALLVSCNDKPKTYSGYSKKDNVYYKLLAIGDGKLKADSAQALWIDASCSTLKDSVFWDTRHNSKNLFFLNHRSFSFSPCFYDQSVGDSMQYLIPTALFFKEFFDQGKTAFFCEKDSCVKFSVKIIKVLAQKELDHIRDSIADATAQRQGREYAEIHEFVTKTFKNAIGFAPGAFMEITKKSELDSIKKGRRVKLIYTGSYLDGRVVDANPGNRPFEFIYGQEGQVLEGLRMALARLKKGEKAKIILPSQLAFGEEGSSNGSIIPNTPLVYEVEVVDVK